MTEVRKCGNDWVYCNGECANCQRRLWITSSTETDSKAERKEE